MSDPEEDLKNRSPGPRRNRLESRRKRRRTRWSLVAALLVVAGSVAAVAGVLDSSDEPPQASSRDSATTSDGEPGRARASLVFGTVENAGGERVVWVALLGYDPEGGTGAVGYIPAHTATEVPGRGLQGLSEAFASGGVPLLLVTAENLLGVPIDSYVKLSDGDAQVMFDAIDPITVDVPSQVRKKIGKGKTRLILDTGRQRLPAGFLVDLIYTLGVDGDDIDLGGRFLALWHAVFQESEGDPEALREALEGVASSLGPSTEDATRMVDALAAIASLPANERVLRSLPVTPLEVPGERLYVAGEDDVRDFVTETVGAPTAASDEVRVQILNGNGVPGIGQEVAAKLVGHDFRIILSGNAPRLNYKETLVITYDSSPEGRRLAEAAKELLGVGRVRVSAQEQGIVDLTIVVGKDFLRER